MFEGALERTYPVLRRQVGDEDSPRWRSAITPNTRRGAVTCTGSAKSRAVAGAAGRSRWPAHG